MGKHLSLISQQLYLPYNPDLVLRAREMRKHPTPAEKKLWQEFLRSSSRRFLRQRPIAHFIVDFYCASLRLVIEVDGDNHFTEDGKAKDLERTQVLQGYRLTVLRFTNREVMEDFEGVCHKIQAFAQSVTLP
jgi:very-short-patch-repair endonuclease